MPFSLTPETKETKQSELEDAFRKLLPNNGNSKAIPYETVIHGIARELLTMVPPKILSDDELKTLTAAMRSLGISGEAPRGIQKKDAPKKSLVNLRNASARLVKVLDQLSPDVLDALTSDSEDKGALKIERRALARLHSTLRILNLVANNTEVRGKRSAPEKIQPYKITKTVAVHYFCLTGKDPTVSRPEQKKPKWAFFNLLTTVYKILGVKASADGQEKKLKKEWNRIKQSLQQPFASSEFNRQKIAT
jgi:hypothetical protein